VTRESRPVGRLPERPGRQIHLNDTETITQVKDLPPDTDHVMDLADGALATGKARVCRECGLLIVPDIVIIEGLAQGHLEPPETFTLERIDTGRRVYVFRDPRGVR
jgi:hypothetical protein